jgi:RND family efflux transporter MFP subunit
LKTIERNQELAYAEYERVQELFDKDSVGTRSGVDAAERAANNAADLARQLEEAVLLYPIQIREAESSLAAAQAALDTAETNLERSEVRSPFAGRVKFVSLEKGQYVTPGQSVLTLANDATLEIEVPLDSRDARQWLRFRKGSTNGETAWFNDLEPVECTIRWTEDREDHVWHGQLHRIVKFDQQTRTLTVAIRIEAQQALSEDPEGLPLVEGMFCSTEIPGRIMQGVIRLPRWAVSFENTVYVSVDSRLKTVPVEVERVQGEEAFVASGLAPGDVVVVTRLIDPLENSLLGLTFAEEEEPGP